MYDGKSEMTNQTDYLERLKHKTIKTDTFHENIKEYYQELPSTRFNSRTAEDVLRLNEQSDL